MQNDGHLPPEIPQIDGRDSFNSVSHRSLAVSFDVSDRTTTYVMVAWSSATAASCAAVVTSRVTCVASVAAASNDRRCANYHAGVRPHSHRRSLRADGHGGLPQRCADGGRIRLRTQIRKNS